MRRHRGLVGALALSVWLGGCAGGSAPRTPSPRPPATDARSYQTLYEAGQFEAVVRRAAQEVLSAGPRDLWFAAQSYLELRRPEDARRLFDRLGTDGDMAWRTAARLAMALLDGDASELAAASVAGEAYPSNPFVQFELGIVLLNRGDAQQAAAALDRSIAADPTLAHAYYYAGLAYQKVNRSDLMAVRFESFLRLAPNAPQRPEVQAVMATIRG